MKNNIISENKIREVLNQILIEESSKVKREEFSRVQFKIEELQNSLNDTIKELRKHIAWYTKNLKNSSEFRNAINQIETQEELLNKVEVESL